MYDTSMTRKTDPKYDDDLVNKRYVDKIAKKTSGDAVPIGSIFDYDGTAVPAGYEEIQTTGSNTNGTWIKFVDGTLICRKAVAKTVNITTAWGNLYEGHMDLGDSPYSFVDTNYQISLSPTNGSGILIEQVGVNRTASNFGTATLVRPGSTSNTNAKVDLIAIGRWK